MDKKQTYYSFLAALVAVGMLFSCRTEKPVHPALIPMPQQLVWSAQPFDLADSSTRFVPRIVEAIPQVQLNSNEAYRLQVSADSVVLEATSETGLFYGLQTVKELAFRKHGKRYLAGCSIVDWPAFAMRGFMQDVGRNFQSLEMLKEQIDVLAAYKLNVFHFHVTENPGWRLESKIYPQLNAAESMTRQKGKYYSQKDFKELVAYCHERKITLIPEFDIPGHSAAFRNAMGFDTMSDPRVQPVLIDLVDELCTLAPADVMPYIHLGTDEVWHSYEKPSPTLLSALLERVTQHHGRELIVWRPGQHIEGDSVSITQLWSSGGHPKPGHRYIDCRLNYLNHLDPLAGIPQLYFERINGAAHGDSLRLGGILCCWNDNNINEENDILTQNPVYPGIVTYSETSWTGQKTHFGETYLAKLPEKGSELYNEFSDFEDRLIEHRDKYFAGKPFPYLKQTNMEWKVLGPIANGGDVDATFPVEDTLQETYQIDTVGYVWQGPFVGGTIHLNHFFGYPSYFPKQEGTYYARTQIWSPKEQTVGAWISFHDWSRSGGRRGGPFPQSGEWHNTHPKVWLNGELVAAPNWDHPGLASNSEEIPFTDENYFFRKPEPIQLKKGWNEVLLKIPVKKETWKRMFTFVPVREENGTMKEVEGLKFSAEIK
ncbi:family 20 glycosylhydrolase [Mangrovibacterium marinum]|uniref:beta-N-acetylhexosaminidase n=1 Tax=Mangrovibacterium marinum TaxID=1639118 RepID=A0A2T5BXY4_9BACT|nr:family 20 glycosylhydrolase [Mangrovibacterium marinum]PTN06312.1 glycosyl hydrolase family 20 [Mangrovibacterium marinum]